MRKEKGVAFSPFFLCSWSKKLSILYTKVYTHAQILSEANFAKRRSCFVRAERSGVLFRTRRRKCSRGSLGTQSVRFSFLEWCLIWFDLISSPWKKRSPLVVLWPSLLSSFFLSLIIIITMNTTSKTVLHGCSGDRFWTLDRFIPRRVGKSRLRERHFRPLRFHPCAERNQGIAVYRDEWDGISSGWRDRSRRRFDRHLGTIRGRERTDVNRRRMVRT